MKGRNINLLDLSDELKLELFRHLSKADRLALGASCRLFHQLSKDKTVKKLFPVIDYSKIISNRIIDLKCHIEAMASSSDGKILAIVTRENGHNLHLLDAT